MLSDALKNASCKDAELRSNQIHTDRVMTALNAFSSESEAVNPKYKLGKINNIKLENISFKYHDSDKYVLSNFNIEISCGEKIAIIGKSGCGKTTLLRVITGLLNPTIGEVYFNGIQAGQIGMTEKFDKIGFIMQENRLFNTTVRENLKYAKIDASDDEMIYALKKAGIYDYISDLPEGLDSEIGEEGVKLSGGQRQKMVLARLFLKDADVYIFDEATSAVDGFSENFINEAILNIGKEKIVIIVSHKNNLSSLCDRVINLDKEGD